MQQEFQSLSLFGLDLAPWLQRWRAGWHALFWGQAGGIRHRLEAPVALETGDAAVRWYVAERVVPAPVGIEGSCYRACLMPSESILLRKMKLPIVVEADLDDVMQLEAEANSPFAADDTCCGWVVNERDSEFLHLTLAITAVSEVMAHLHARGHDGELPEVWCLDEQDRPIVLQGFGERRRAADYRRRLGWLGGMVGLAVVLCCALLLVPGLVRQMQADNMEYHHAEAEAEASEAMQLREQLARNNERALALHEMFLKQYNYPLLLDSLTASAPDSVYLEQLGIEWGEIRLRGWADNAAAYMQTLTENPDYAEVRAPGAFRRHGRTQLEQFVLHLKPVGSGS